MSFKSAIYECHVRHKRSNPVNYAFKNRIFCMALDLDELEILDRKLFGFRYNRAGLFSFYDIDHFPGYTGNVKERVRQFLAENNIDLDDGRVTLICHPRTFGYGFNPASFFYCETTAGKPLCAIVQVENTFYEIKPFLIPYLDASPEEKYPYQRIAAKNFYVSPFARLDSVFDFKLGQPGEQVQISIQSLSPEGEVIVNSYLEGTRKPVETLWRFGLLYPFMALQVMLKIHWHALMLALKKVPFNRKEVKPELQTNVLRPHKSLRGFS